MSKSLLDLLNKTRGDIASKRGNNVDLTRLKDGNNFLRIFPNKDDPNGVFFQTFGMHYVKTRLGKTWVPSASKTKWRRHTANAHGSFTSTQAAVSTSSSL